MKLFLPWLIAGVALGAAGILWSGSHSKSAELIALQNELQELRPLQAEVAELKSKVVPAEEIAQLRKDKEDLLRLRNQVQQLRGEKQELAKQAQAAQNALLGVQAESQRLQAQAQAQVKVLTTPPITQTTAGQLNFCLNNLRQIEAAKQQWALENNKTAEAIPNVPDLLPYFKDEVLPICPAHGSYTLNSVVAIPTCSVSGHQLAPQTP